MVELGIGPPPSLLHSEDSDSDIRWAEWILHIKEICNGALKLLHGRIRREERKNQTAMCKKKHQLYEDNKLGKYIKFALNERGSTGMAQQLTIRDPDTGVPSLIHDPKVIKSLLREGMQNHLGAASRKKWFINNSETGKVNHPTLADTEEGWSRRRTLQYTRHQIPAAQYDLPTVFQDVICNSGPKWDSF